MPEPLILHAPTLDATAAAQLLLDRWHGAEVEELPAGKAFCRHYERRDVWLIGSDAPSPLLTVGTSEVIRAIDPTTDASCVMQVWRMLHGEYGLRCDGCNTNSPCGPPWHVRYIDDAVCERLALPDSLEVWEAAQSYPADEAALYLRSADNSDEWRTRLANEGHAILRARKRWEKGVHLRLAEAWGQQENEELREETMRLNGVCERLRTERDAAIADAERLRGVLAEISSHGCGFSVRCRDAGRVGDDRCWSCMASDALRELAGGGS